MNLPRGGISSSNRLGSFSSKSLREGLPSVGFVLASDAPRSRFHSSTGITTAVSTPRFVMICGPSVTLALSNSLKRAFAS